MSVISIVYQTGGGHTAILAEAIAEGAKSIEGITVNLIRIEGKQVIDGRWKDDSIMALLNESDAIIFGCATYMGSVSAIFKAFLERAFEPWMEQSWKDKIAGGFTNSASQNGDKFSTLMQLVVFALQMNMLWVGVGDPPSNNWSGGSDNHINRLGCWLGVAAQSNGDQGPDLTPCLGDRETSKRYGARIAMITRKWKGESDYTIDRITEEKFRSLNQELFGGLV